jgi:N-acetylglutamate synthase-like GNAT family acetyltransferase
MDQRSEFVLREAIPGADDEAVTQLFAEYLAWAHPKLRDEYGIEDPPTSAEKIAATLAAFRRPRGVLLIAEHEGQAVGVGALRRHGSTVAEVKRMFVQPHVRNLHVGSSLLDRLIEDARDLGAQVLRLDTVRFMTDAQQLYRSRGFVERRPYDETEIPEPLRKYWLFFERAL